MPVRSARCCVERTAHHGVWWVLQDGLRTFGFNTREEARDYRRRLGGPNAVTFVNKNLSDIIHWRGIDAVLRQMASLHPRERQILGLVLTGQSQTEIARVVGVSQPAINYTISRAAQRMEYFIGRPTFDRGQMTQDLESANFQSSEDAGILVDFWAVGSQSRVAEKYQRTQGFIRHRITRSLKHLARLNGGDEKWRDRCRAYCVALEDLLSKGHLMLPMTRKQ